MINIFKLEINFILRHPVREDLLNDRRGCFPIVRRHTHEITCTNVEYVN